MSEENAALPDGWLHVFVDVAPAVAERSERFWVAALGWPLGNPWPDHPEFAAFEPSEGESYVHRQSGDHGPRIHLDVEVGDVDTARARLLALGAQLEAVTEGWQPMSSPGGFPFCLAPRGRTRRPAPQRWPGGHRSRLLQVCLDVPPELVDAEVGFWRAFLDWRWAPGSSAEFLGKLFPDRRLPVQLLFQRLDAPEPRTRAHLDLGTDDIEAEVGRLAGLGATRGPSGDGWVVLTDPAGMEFCVTGNPPD